MSRHQHSSSRDKTALIAALRRELESPDATCSRLAGEPISTGSIALDHFLPTGGLRRGNLVEYLADDAASGAGALAFAAAREACDDGKRMVVIDRAGKFYPLVVAAWGFELAQLILLRPGNNADTLWALDQALRCPGVGAVLAERDARLDARDFRRLQLAAESAGTLGVLIGPAVLRGQPTWADVRWLIEPQPSRDRWRVLITLLRCRGGTGGANLNLELDELAKVWSEASGHYASNHVPLPAELANPTATCHQSRA
jgi:protein ImuA